VVRVCISPICRMIGSMDLLHLLEHEMGVAVGGTTSDGLFTLEETHCLGQCAGAPAMMVDRRTYVKLSAARVRRILETLRRKNSDA
jgi:NADH:ubiquinone oxidoreductase subunit E